MRIVAISDSHNFHDKVEVPDGDILIIAGDLTKYGTAEEIRKVNYWLGTQPHEYAIVIPGNHDEYFQSHPAKARDLITNAHYLEDSGIKIAGLKFWGSPWVPKFGNWSFSLERGQELAKKWALIPNETDILITHAPPYGILDEVRKGEHVGCEELAKRVRKIKPRLHIFGHIHYAAGIEETEHTTFVNASICVGRSTESLKPKNKPKVIDL